MKHLCLPYFLLKRTDWDKFPGAYYTIGVDTPMLEGRSLQIGSIHHYRENFSKPFEIKYEDVDGSMKYRAPDDLWDVREAWSARSSDSTETTKDSSSRRTSPPSRSLLSRSSRKAKSRRFLPRRGSSAGARGGGHPSADRRAGGAAGQQVLPLGAHAASRSGSSSGQRDIAEGKVAYAVRFDGAKGGVLRTNVVKDVQAILVKISEQMTAAAKERLAASVADIDSLENPPKKILRFGWCGSEECGHEIEAKTELKLLARRTRRRSSRASASSAERRR